MSSVVTYTDADMQSHTDYQQIRYAPGGFVVDADEYGQYHTIKEILDNANDEVSILNDASMDVLFFQDTKNGVWQVIIKDSGRGIPLNSVRSAVTELKFSGKFTSNAYKTSSGMFGYGLTVSTALASKYRVMAYRDNEIVSVDNYNDHEGDHIKETRKPFTHSSGTTVAFEIEPRYFTNVDRFLNEGYVRIIEFLKTLSIFSNVTFSNPDISKYRFYIFSKPIKDKFWNLEADEAVSFIEENYLKEAQPIFDSIEALDSLNYLSELWELNCPFVWRNTEAFQRVLSQPIGFTRIIKHKNVTEEEPIKDLGYDIRIYLPKVLKSSKVLSLINNVVIRKQTSTHIEVFKQVIKSKISDKILDEELRKYFDEIYDIPICCAMNIAFEGAQFSGITKDGFIDSYFGACFKTLLTEQAAFIPDRDYDEILNHISKHLQASYAAYYNKPILTKKIYKDVQTRWFDCSTSNRQEAEMFIVEGISAEHLKLARDPDTQAVYLIYGKPSNTVLSPEEVLKSRKKIEKYPPYVELKKILNIESNQTDISHCNFGKIIICTDADIDGYHIASLHLGNLFIINPLLITEGFVYVANPPLYEIANGRQENIPLRDKNDLIEFWLRIYSVYLNIYYRSEATQNELVKADELTLKGLCYSILEIGEYLTECAKQFAISPIILERLALVSQALNPDFPNISLIEQVLGTKVLHNPVHRTLIIEFKNQDNIIPLAFMQDQLYSNILPKLQSIAWKNIDYFVEAKNVTPGNLQQVTIVQLYEILVNINSILKIKRYKGLGEMSKESLETAFTNHNTRHLTRITSLGDINVLYGMLGVDVTMRKDLLRDPTGMFVV